MPGFIGQHAPPYHLFLAGKNSRLCMSTLWRGRSLNAPDDQALQAAVAAWRCRLSPRDHRMNDAPAIFCRSSPQPPDASEPSPRLMRRMKPATSTLHHSMSPSPTVPRRTSRGCCGRCTPASGSSGAACGGRPCRCRSSGGRGGPCCCGRSGRASPSPSTCAPTGRSAQP